MAGKGSRRRPTNEAAYSDAWDRIFNRGEASKISEDEPYKGQRNVAIEGADVPAIGNEQGMGTSCIDSDYGC